MGVEVRFNVFHDQKKLVSIDIGEPIREPRMADV
jgi:hypothetical protein